MDSISRWYEESEFHKNNSYYLNTIKKQVYSTFTWLFTMIITVYSQCESFGIKLYRDYLLPNMPKKAFFPIKSVIVVGPDQQVRCFYKDLSSWEAVNKLQFKPGDTIHVLYCVEDGEQAIAVFRGKDGSIPNIVKEVLTFKKDYDKLSILGIECYPDKNDDSKRQDITDIYHMYHRCSYGGLADQVPNLCYQDMIDPATQTRCVVDDSQLEVIDGDTISHSYDSDVSLKLAI